MQLNRNDHLAGWTYQDVLRLRPASDHHLMSAALERVEDPGIDILPRLKTDGYGNPERPVSPSRTAFTVTVINERAS